MTLTIWGRRTSSNVQALMWCVGELGLAHLRHDIGHVHGGNDTPEFLAMNPNGLVPVLQDGDDEPIWETGAILRYLAARYGPDSFWPTDPARRARVDKWAEWAKLNVALGFTGPVFWQVVRTAPSQQDPRAIAEALARLACLLKIAEGQLADREYLAGDDFTLADIQFGHVLYRYFDIDIARPAWPAIERYYAALVRRPAFAEHVMVSYEPLRVTE
ncbi:glutathione S-transferase family protein [Devosia salina]|uniref:Glutathione S-transferase family protein n=1 Tax=Devosia salina TaxID=2860336 RepID=A0ABX8WE30_9HYPH|nr:glutathione S-transferase family protein [Devosia salina]QYO76410.1 glutathione S-transferase family protein [Devosia salina]